MQNVALDRLTNPIRRGGAIIITSQCIVSRIVSHRIRTVSISYPHRIVSSHEALYRIVSYRYCYRYRYRYRIVPCRYRIVFVSYPYRPTNHCVALYRLTPYRIVSVSYRVRVLTSPRLHVSTSPCLRVSTSPRPHVSTSPRRRVSTSPRL